MGTSNFHNKNASKVFAVLMDREQQKLDEDGNETEETETVYPDKWESDELKDYLKELAEKKAKDLPYKYSEEEGSDNDRNYNATNIFSYSISKYYGDVEVFIKIVSQIRGAYYEGANLDFKVTVYNGYEHSELEDGYYKITVKSIIDGLFEVGYEGHIYSSMGKGLRAILAKKAIKWAEKEVEKMKTLVEEIFTQVSDPLEVVARFSNGETMYRKAS